MQILKMFYSFKGRLNRLRFFLYGLPINIIVTVAYNIALRELKASPESSFLGIMIIYFTVIGICAVATFSLSARRLHDLNMSGWFTLVNFLNLIPYIKVIVFVFHLVLLFKVGTSGPNDYGDDPLLEEYEEAPVERENMDNYYY